MNIEQLKEEGYNALNKCVINFRAVDDGNIRPDQRDSMNKKMIDELIDKAYQLGEEVVDIGEILTDYSNWLYNKGYLDADWYTEADNETTVVDYMMEKSIQSKSKE